MRHALYEEKSENLFQFTASQDGGVGFCLKKTDWGVLSEKRNSMG